MGSFDEHDGVVKCVRARDENVVASTGNDRVVNIFDSRTTKRQLFIEDAHDLVVNSVRWLPVAEATQFTTTSFSPEIRLWDIRQPRQWVTEFKSHTPLSINRCKTIYHPLFLQHGGVMLSNGDGVHDITLYDVKRASVLSRYDAGFQATAFASTGDSRILAAQTSSIQCFACES